MDDRRRRFESQVLPHLDAAYRLARWLSSSPTDAEDVVQDAVLRAFRGFDAFRGEEAKAWLLVIVRNCHRSLLQHQRRRPTQPLPDDSDAREFQSMIADTPDPAEQAACADQTKVLVRLLLELPADQREVLVLKEIEDLSYREIARVIGAPIGTVMSRLARARTALKGRWIEKGANPDELR